MQCLWHGNLLEANCRKNIETTSSKIIMKHSQQSLLYVYRERGGNSITRYYKEPKISDQNYYYINIIVVVERELQTENSKTHGRNMFTKGYGAWLQLQIQPQSTKGRWGYPPSGGGCSDGGKLPHDIPIPIPIPILSPTTFPA